MTWIFILNVTSVSSYLCLRILYLWPFEVHELKQYLTIIEDACNN